MMRVGFQTRQFPIRLGDQFPEDALGYLPVDQRSSRRVSLHT